MNEPTQQTKDETVYRVCQFLREEVGPHVGVEMNCERCPINIETPRARDSHVRRQSQGTY